MVVTIRLDTLTAKELLPLALLAVGPIITTTISRRDGPHVRTDWITHESWGFEWEELAAIIFLATNLRTDQIYTFSNSAELAAHFNQHDHTALATKLHNDLYDPSTWIATAHAVLDADQ